MKKLNAKETVETVEETKKTGPFIRVIDKENLVAFVDGIFVDGLAFNNVAIRKNKEGNLYVNYPQYSYTKNDEKVYKSHFSFTKENAEKFNQYVMGCYHAHVDGTEMPDAPEFHSEEENSARFYLNPKLTDEEYDRLEAEGKSIRLGVASINYKGVYISNVVFIKGKNLNLIFPNRPWMKDGQPVKNKDGYNGSTNYVNPTSNEIRQELLDLVTKAYDASIDEAESNESEDD